MAREFTAFGLEFETVRALDGNTLSPENYAQVDQEARRRQGLYPLPNGSIANWLTQRRAMRDLVENGPDMMAVFEDDVRFTPALPAILSVLERGGGFPFDVVFFHRRDPTRAFVPCHELETGHTLGRVRYADYGSEGYVITREAARHFLEVIPKMIREIDQSLSRFWDNGLNVFYIDPPVAWSEGEDDSQIEAGRAESRRKQQSDENRFLVLGRRASAGLRREVIKRVSFRKLMRGEIGVAR